MPTNPVQFSSSFPVPAELTLPVPNFSGVFRNIAASLDQADFLRSVRIPRPTGMYERPARMHYHLNPEVFVQLSGTTEFSFPDQRFTLNPNEICVIPRGLPHGEIARGKGGEPFENLVVSFYNEMIDIHIAHEVDGLPAADDVHFFVTDLYGDLVAQLERACTLYHEDSRLYATAIKGLLLAGFSLLATLIDSPPTAAVSDLVTAARRVVQRRLQDEALSLEAISAELRCSPTYLSKLFHKETGERLVEYINRLRVRQSVEALRHSQLSVKTVAGACGFSDANYFARVFRDATGRSPRQFRMDFHRVARLQKLPPIPTADAHAVDNSVTVEGFGVARDAELMARRNAR